jgi:hypothetical protein
MSEDYYLRFYKFRILFTPTKEIDDYTIKINKDKTITIKKLNK